MLSQVSTNLLKVHPKNQEYYADLPEEKYQEIKQSIESQGIRDPLKILPDYTVVAGHQRLRIAQDLGLEKIPVVVLDISPEEAEYLLIADNEERRQVDNDPIRKAKRAKFLTEYWEIRKGGDRSNQYAGKISEVAKGNNFPLPNTDIPKTLHDVAKAVGEDVRTLKNILKLNDLIPDLQFLVSNKKLGSTAAYSLAFLTPEEQESLLKTLGESGVCDLSVSEAADLRQDLERERKNTEGLQVKLCEAEEEKQRLSRQISEMENIMADIKDDIAENIQRQFEEKMESATASLRRNIENLKEKLEKSQEKQELLKNQKDTINYLQNKIAEMEGRLKLAESAPAGNIHADAEASGKVEALKREQEDLEKNISRLKNAIVFRNYAQNLFRPIEKKEDEFDDLLRETDVKGLYETDVRRWVALLKRYILRMEEALATIHTGSYVIDIGGAEIWKQGE